MSEANYSIDRDLEEAKAFADHLIPYVYEEPLYGNISGMFNSKSMPSLTLGALLMRLRRLHAQEDRMSDSQKALLASIEAQNESVRREWTIHYQNKLSSEALSRLKVIEQYLGECAEDAKGCASNYLPEVLRRTIAEEILAALEGWQMPSAEVEAAAKKVDSGLRRFVQPSDFVWAKALEPYYPKTSYWWLYSRPPQPTS